MKDELVRTCDAHMVKPVVVERSTPLGTVIYAETTKGRFFLKCTLPLQNDAAYTEALSRIVPKFVVAPVALDLKKQMMITSDYGNILIPAGFEMSDVMKLSRDYAELQRQTIGKVDELVRSGMPDFREEGLLKRMDWLTDHPMLDTIANRTEHREAVEFYRRNVEKLKRKVNELFALGIPATVSHNDFLESNVYRTEDSENFMFFDWVDGHVGHLFTSEFDAILEEEYLKGWEDYSNLKTLNEWLRRGKGVRFIMESILRVAEAECMEEPGAGEAFEGAIYQLSSVYSVFRGKI